MSGGSKKVTVGYKYYVGMHMALCHGPVDKLVRIRVGGKDAWIGTNTGGALTINKPDLFGGEKREGGVSGQVDIELGGTSQGQNSYLASKLGSSLLPAFRGVCCAVLRQVYVGLNPYLKDWGWLVQRIHKTKNGETQWYDIKSEIPRPQPNSVPRVVAQYVETFSGIKATADPYIGTQLSDYPPTWDFTNCPAYHNEGPGEYLEIFTDVTDVVKITVLEGAWSKHHDGTGLLPGQTVPSCGLDTTPPWIAEVAVMFENGAVQRLYTTEYSTPAAAEAAAKASPTALSGHTRYTIWLMDGYLWNMGSLKVQVEVIRTQGETNDMNPAHIIRECLTDTNWGLGYPESDIDDASFTASANTLFSEGMGISILWSQQTSINDFVEEILRHIDAALFVDRSTGKFVLKLIRGGYDPASLLVLDESNINRVENYTKQTLAELVNEVTVTYNSSESGQGETVTVQNLALIQQQGAIISSSIEYPGFSHAAIAATVAARDLKATSSPVVSATIYANRKAAGLNIGDVFKWQWTELDESGAGVATSYVMRVAEIAFGDGVDNTVRIQCVQDVFALPDITYVEADPTEWVDPSAQPLPASPRLVTETPYYEIVRTLGDVEANTKLTSLPELGYLMVAAGRQGGEINADVHVDSGSGYVESALLDFCPYATLNGAIGPMDTVVAVQGGDGIEDVAEGSLAQIDHEIVVIESVAGSSVTIRRGCLDTIPGHHASGAALMAWDGYATSDNVEYVDSDEVGVKILSVTGSGTLYIGTAPEDTVTMDQRALRPYPPANVKINGEYYPETVWAEDLIGIVATWAHRSRTQQTGGTVLGWKDGSVGPEADVTYSARLVLGLTQAEIGTASEIAGLTHTFTTPHRGQMRLEAWSERDGLRSMQIFSHIFNYVDPDGSILWDPTLTNPLLWLDASDENTIIYDGDGVSKWVDKSPRAIEYDQATNLAKPAKGTNAIVFDGTDFLQSSTSIQPSDDGLMIVFAVMERSVGNQGTLVLNRLSGVIGSFHFVKIGSTCYVYSDGVNTPSNTTISETDFNALEGGTRLVRMRHVPGNRMKFFAGGTEKSVLAGMSSVTTGSAGSRIGCREGSIGAHLVGKAHEILILPIAMEESFYQTVDGYLAHKWDTKLGQTTLVGDLPSGHPYKTQPPLKPPTTIDLYWNNTKACLNPSPGFADATGRAVTVVGNVQSSTVDGKPSFVFAGGNDFLRYAASADFQFGNGDWTIEFLIYKTANNPNASRLWNPDGDLYDGVILGIDPSGKFTCYGSSSGSLWNLWSAPSIAAIPNNVVTYLAVSRVGGVVQASVNGTIYPLHRTLGTTSLFYNTGARAIGGQSGVARGFIGHILGVRVTKGAGRDISVIPALPFKTE
ncbi:MAG: phage tail protein [Desulfomicrobium sp.]|nr:phage tail protein [Desulfomicrobium sp.]